METTKRKLLILHAGLGHPSPYFYNLCNEFKRYPDIDLEINPNLPLEEKTENGIIYFNRLKRYYNSNDINSINSFLNKVDILKTNGWKLIFTLHNFFPIDRSINENDEYLLRNFLPKMDFVFTFSNSIKNSLKKHFNIEAINHSIGKNTLDSVFDTEITLPTFSPDDFVFTFIGNVSEYKMLDEVIECFNKLGNKNAYLIIAGPQGRNYELNYEPNERIIRIDTFIGDKSWNRLCSITNIFLNTYDTKRPCFKYGFFPSNCIQLMNKKKICIVPNCEEMKEILPPNYYYTYETVADLEKTMNQVIKDAYIIKEKEATYPDSFYSWKHTVKIIIDELRRL